MFYSPNMATLPFACRKYHTDLSPTELKWRSVKEYAAKQNVRLRLDDAIKLTEVKFNLFKKRDWSRRCNNAFQ
jgi:hypothetical protein